MADVLTRARLKPSAPQLPISWYFDREIFEREQATVFANGPRYAGHELMVPEAGDYITLDTARHAKMLVRGADGVRLLNNVCRHRQSLLLEGRGNLQSIVCPVHKWTYALDGRLMGAPDFDENPGLALVSTPLTNWHGLLFAGKRDVAKDLADFPLAHEYNFSGYMFERVQADLYPYNWKNFLEIYLEMYHVVPFHPGLQYFVDPGNYQWGFGERWSYQILGIKDELKTQVSPHYTRYRNALLQYGDGKLPKYGTLWCILYPNVMLEWYPYSLVVSTLLPLGSRPDPQRGGVLLPGGGRAVRARAGGGAPGRLCRVGRRGQRYLHLVPEGQAGALCQRRGGRGPVPLAARGRHGPLHEFLRRELAGR